MKKSSKGVIIIAIILIISGIALIIGGMAASGGVSTLRENLFRLEDELDHIFEFDQDQFDIEFDNGRFHFEFDNNHDSNERKTY